MFHLWVVMNRGQVVESVWCMILGLVPGKVMNLNVKLWCHWLVRLSLNEWLGETTWHCMFLGVKFKKVFRVGTSQIFFKLELSEINWEVGYQDIFWDGRVGRVGKLRVVGNREGTGNRQSSGRRWGEEEERGGIEQGNYGTKWRKWRKNGSKEQGE
jgi:hypothetical protein